MLFWNKSIIRNTLLGIYSLLFSSILFASASIEGIQVYSQDVDFSWERKQRIADDLDHYNNADNIWDVLRQEFTLPHYEDNPLVQEKIEWFLEHQNYLVNSMNRAAPYLYYISQQTKKRHLPAELVLLPIIESAYNPFAINASSGASGIWQMMPDTASGYGVRQNWWYDGRRDIIASTKAALNHLAYLQSFFEGNWLLAIAAYDTGEGNVLSAIRKNINNGENTDYWSLPLAQETQDYVPRLLALATIISHPYKYFINFPPVPNAPYLAEVNIGSQIALQHAASFAGLSLKQLKQLNPGYNRSATDPHGPFKLVLPIENVEQFTENLARYPLYQHINWAQYKVKSGDTLTTIAKRFHTTPSSLLKTNPSLAQIPKTGTNIIISRTTPNISKTILESEQPVITAENHPILHRKTALAASLANKIKHVSGSYALQPGDTLYMVRQKDDLSKIAKRFRIAPNTLAKINQLNSRELHPGQKIIIPTHKNSTSKYELTPGDTIYMVRRGDTIEKIAQQFHTTPTAIRLINLLASNDLQEGDRLVIPTHV